jgi:hypothetical protein
MEMNNPLFSMKGNLTINDENVPETHVTINSKQVFTFNRKEVENLGRITKSLYVMESKPIFGNRKIEFLIEKTTETEFYHNIITIRNALQKDIVLEEKSSKGYYAAQIMWAENYGKFVMNTKKNMRMTGTLKYLNNVYTIDLKNKDNRIKAKYLINETILAKLDMLIIKKGLSLNLNGTIETRDFGKYMLHGEIDRKQKYNIANINVKEVNGNGINFQYSIDNNKRTESLTLESNKEVIIDYNYKQSNFRLFVDSGEEFSLTLKKNRTDFIFDIKTL